MDPRKHRVLQAIIDDYIRTAEPVGSRSLARAHALGVSPATIRNEMADLEEMGYLEQPHTSAGRVPSDKGYRYYVDCLVGDAGEEPPDGESVRRILALRARLIEDVVRQAARLLAEATDCLALASSPDTQPVRVRALRTVPLDGEHAVLILVGEDGSLRSKVMHVGRALDVEGDLERIAVALSARLEGTLFGGVGLDVVRLLQRELGQYREVVDEVLGWLDDGQSGDAERLVMDGATNLFKQPEFRDVAKARTVLAALEHEDLVDHLLGAPPAAAGGAVDVVIGREMQVQEMEDCSLVSAIYLAPGRVFGRIGVLGPRRMDYRNVMRMVERVATGLSEVLDGGSGGGGPRRSAAETEG